MVSKIGTDELRALRQTLKKLKGGKPNPGSELALPEVIEIGTPQSNGKPFARAGKK